MGVRHLTGEGQNAYLPDALRRPSDAGHCGRCALRHATERALVMASVPEKLYRRIAALVLSCENCRKSGNSTWLDAHTQRIAELVKAHMPSGAGFDCGTRLDFDKSTPERLVFHTEFHHTDDSGTYSGWTSHTVTVRASLWAGIEVHIGGRNVRDIKEYVHETFHAALTAEVA